VRACDQFVTMIGTEWGRLRQTGTDTTCFFLSSAGGLSDGESGVLSSGLQSGTINHSVTRPIFAYVLTYII
jgi:hypothetical protein